MVDLDVFADCLSLEVSCVGMCLPCFIIESKIDPLKVYTVMLKEGFEMEAFTCQESP